MRKAINLNNLVGLPTKYLAGLDKHRDLFEEDMFLDSLLENPQILSTVQQINSYCLNNPLIGFHYTRAFPNEISEQGLVCRTGTQIRQSFLSKYLAVFRQDEIEMIKKSWNDYFDLKQQQSRDSRLFFNFTTTESNHPGGQNLLFNFGGEQIHFPLENLTCISEKIKSLGTPMILKCVLDPKNLNTFREYPWGRIAASTYHCQLNQEAVRDDQDGYQFENVSPSNIEIIVYDADHNYQMI